MAPAFALALALAVRFPVQAPAAPSFALSGDGDRLAARIVANDSRGEVSALEVLLYLEAMRRPEREIPPAAWLDAAAGSDRDRAGIEAATLEYMAARSLAAARAPYAPPGEGLSRAMLHAAAEVAWIETAVEPAIVVAPADVSRSYLARRDLYALPDRARVRYIFQPVDELTEPGRLREAMSRLEAIRSEVASGARDFAEAARAESKAPSARDGGLIPDFERGTHFKEFEYHAFRIESPGRMSPVFSGADGVYLIQLVDVRRGVEIPFERVREEIATRLRGEHVRPYRDLMLDRLRERGFVQDLSAQWAYLDAGAPLAFAAGRRLERDDLLRLDPECIGADYQPRWSAIVSGVEAWIEGELALRDLERRGGGDHPYLEIGRRVWRTVLASRAELSRRVDPPATLEEALRALGVQGPASGIPRSRVVRLTFVVPPEALTDPARALAARATRDGLAAAAVAGTLPTSPEPIAFARTLSDAASVGDRELADEIARVQGLLDVSSFLDVRATVEDLGWLDALPLASPSPELPALRAGEVGAPIPLEETVRTHCVVATTLDENSPLLKRPALLRSIARDMLVRQALEEEVERVRGGVRFSAEFASGIPQPGSGM